MKQKFAGGDNLAGPQEQIEHFLSGDADEMDQKKTAGVPTA
ncbi:hypothetical protein [Paenibacillus thalictri]|nr:hypothetical protein [Paenibacillus thalictri]